MKRYINYMMQDTYASDAASVAGMHAKVLMLKLSRSNQ